jgi:hypothetical protein
MINSAVPIQAYDGGVETTDMVEQDWTSIDPGFYASNWYRQFDGTGDARNGLTWRATFSSVGQIETHNFYSPGEEVLDKRPGLNDASVWSVIFDIGADTFDGRGAWKVQELVKGKNGFESLASLVLERSQAGWRINDDYMPGDDIRETPRFQPFLESDLHSPDSVAADQKAGQTDPNVRFDLLARGIPALSYAAAVDVVPVFGGGVGPDARNFDMEEHGRGTEWPTEEHDSDEDPGRWLHNDFRNVALGYVTPMYQEMIDRGNLNDE